MGFWIDSKNQAPIDLGATKRYEDLVFHSGYYLGLLLLFR